VDRPRSLAAETLKLLLQVAWADHAVSEPEAAALRGMADRAGLDEAEHLQLEAWLGGDDKLPPPDLGYLRRHRDEVLALAREMAAADREVVEDEQAILDQIAELLG
jgi:uncharacterized tellurite resistance protein B-like protein